MLCSRDRQREKDESGRESGAVKRVRTQLMLFDPGRVDMPSPERYLCTEPLPQILQADGNWEAQVRSEYLALPPGQLMEGWNRSEEVIWYGEIG